MRKITVQPDKPQKTIRRISFACWIPKATNSHPEYVILIAFPLQHWLHERTSMSRYTYFACLCILRSVTTCFTQRCGRDNAIMYGNRSSRNTKLFQNIKITTWLQCENICRLQFECGKLTYRWSQPRVIRPIKCTYVFIEGTH